LQESIYSRIGYELKRTQHGLHLSMDARLRPLGLSTPQYAVLANVRDNPGVSGAQLARNAFVSAQAMNEVVSGLERYGLLQRDPSPRHGRIIETRLTKRGRRLLERADAEVLNAERQLVALLDRDEAKVLFEMLRRCADAIRTPDQAERRSV